jgi:hypothetical protein
VPTFALRYDVRDEHQVKVRSGQLIATQYGQLGLVFERHHGGLFELYSTDREIMRRVWYATRQWVTGSAVEG